jgi:hypothetical protein
MYFRKPPTFHIPDTMLEENEPIQFDLAPLVEFANQFNSVLSGTLDRFMDRFFAELEKKMNTTVTIEPPKIKTKLTEEEEAKLALELAEAGRELAGDEVTDRAKEFIAGNDRQSPRGDEFRVVDEVPMVPRQEITNKQQDMIDELKQHGNISVLPGATESGAIRVMSGSEEYIIERDGNFTNRDTGAGTNSLV